MNGIERITTERLRQINVEGYGAEHDLGHGLGDLIDAARCYSLPFLNSHTPCPKQWPWTENWWKPSDDEVRNLEKAGALIAAEIDRILSERGQ